jgi:lipoyltransferase/lipoate-protein ligase
MFGRKAREDYKSLRIFDLSTFPSGDPVENLSLEHHLFTQFPNGGREQLLFYINETAVVIGKHQNPWKEVSPDVLIGGYPPLYRRFTGGGTVFHDTGNVNWSFIASKQDFSQEENLEIIADLASDFSGIPRREFETGERGDLFCRGLKISGNALAFRGEKALHHGTLLIDSDLGALSGSLCGLGRLPGISVAGPGVDSNPVPVGNLRDISGVPMTAAGFVNYVTEGQDQLRTELITEKGPNPRVDPELSQRYRSADWHFRRTPDFRIILGDDCSFAVHRGTAVSECPELALPGKQWDLAEPLQYAELFELIKEISAGALTAPE